MKGRNISWLDLKYPSTATSSIEIHLHASSSRRFPYFFSDFPFDDLIRWPHVSRWQATQADPSQPSGQKAVCEADNEEKMKKCAFDDMLKNKGFVPFVHGFFAEFWRLYRRERKRH